MWHHLPARLRAFGASRPELEVRLDDPPPWEALEQLREHRADVAAIMVADADDFARRYGDEFVIRRWRRMPLVGVFADADAPAGPVTLAEFATRELVLPQRTAALASLPELVERARADAGVRPARIRTMSTIQTSLPLVQAGLGVGILPDPGGEVLARFGVVARELAPAPPPLEALLVARRSRERRAIVDAFLDARDPAQ